jgi:histidinol-phosphate aminotransferase
MKDDFFEQLAREHVRGLHAYTPGLQPKGINWVKLNTNENPYPPSPRVAEAIEREVGDGLRLYPDPRSSRLRDAVAAHHGLADGSQVCIGNGSDDILNLLTRAFCSGEKAAAFTFPSYSLYPVLIAIENGRMIEVEFDRSMRLDVDRLAATEANILFFTSPNAPTGVGFGLDEIEALLQTFAGLVVVDEAYADFAETDATPLLAQYPNLCITRSFSKSYGLAGLRVGYLLGHSRLIEVVDRVRDSYNVNRLSQAGALAAIEDQPYFRAVVGKIKETRDFYRSEFEQRGWFTYPSQTNFLLTEPRDRNGRAGKEVAQSLYDFLVGHKILVRYFPSHDLTCNFLRISVGSEPEMLTLAETIDRWLQDA